METIHLLAVSREAAVLRLLWSMAESNSWHLESAASGLEAMERVQSGVAPHLLLLDLPRGDAESLHILRWLRRIRPHLPVIGLSSADDASGAQEAIRLGAKEILPGPFSEQQIEFAIQRHLGWNGNGQGNIFGEPFEPQAAEGLFVSASPIMQKLRAHVELLAQADVPVLILGEAGSGKYAVASLIHQLSVRSGFKLLKVNCAEMPEALLEAELFGEGAVAVPGTRPSLGRFAPGEKGTIYLEEIAEMPAALQARLVEVLQNQGLQNTGRGNSGPLHAGPGNHGLGDPRMQNRGLQKPGMQDLGTHDLGLQPELRRPAVAEAVPAEVRIMAASSTNLGRALAAKQLREDLYYSLSVFTVHVPPLRQRKDEIATLLRYLMHKLAKHYSLAPRTFSPAVLEACQRYSWPGNLKELETFVKRYLVAGGPDLTVGDNGTESTEGAVHVPQERTVTMAASPWTARELGSRELGSRELGSRELGSRELGSRELGQRDLRQRESGEKAAAEPESLKALIQGIKSEAEQNAIGAALKRTGWNRKAAARLLRVSYRTLLYKIEQYHMRAPDSYLTPPPGEEFSLPGNGVKGNGDGKVS